MHKLVQRTLHGLDDVGFELLELVLNCEDLFQVAVFFRDLLVQAIVDAATEQVGVVRAVDLVFGVGVIGCSILSQHFDKLLRISPSLCYVLCGFCRSRFKLLGFSLDLVLQLLDDR